jgi:thiamine biosynthesis lipoprotein
MSAKDENLHNQRPSDGRPSRRVVLRIAAATVSGGTLGFVAWRRRREPVRVTDRRLLMGTLVNLTLVADDERAAQAAADACFARMVRLEGVLSRHDRASQVAQLNDTGMVAMADAALVDVLDQARRLSELSDGAFDMTVAPLVDLYRGLSIGSRETGRWSDRDGSGASPVGSRPPRGDGLPDAQAIEAARGLVGFSRVVVVPGSSVRVTVPGTRVTLDGIAKGYIVDAGVEVLRAHGFRHVSVEAGGDLRVSGTRVDGGAWRIGVQAPRAGRVQPLVRFAVTDRAVATSGDYQQAYTADLSAHHIVDPRSGRSPATLASATVIAPTAVLADALATTVMVLGPEAGLDLVARVPDCDALVVTKDGRQIGSGAITRITVS